jgi:hypothetical protein
VRCLETINFNTESALRTFDSGNFRLALGVRRLETLNFTADLSVGSLEALLFSTDFDGVPHLAEAKNFFLYFTNASLYKTKKVMHTKYFAQLRYILFVYITFDNSTILRLLFSALVVQTY